MRPYSQFGKYEWPMINNSINWAPNHPITGTQCTHLSLTDGFIYSANCVYGPVLALCDSQYSNTEYYYFMIKVYLFRNEFDDLRFIKGGKLFHMHLEIVKNNKKYLIFCGSLKRILALETRLIHMIKPREFVIEWGCTWPHLTQIIYIQTSQKIYCLFSSLIKVSYIHISCYSDVL